jgi:hypothetical protein
MAMVASVKAVYHVGSVRRAFRSIETLDFDRESRLFEIHPGS